MKFNRENEMNVIFNSALFSDALQHQIKTDLARSRIIEASDIVQLEFFFEKRGKRTLQSISAIQSRR